MYGGRLAGASAAGAETVFLAMVAKYVSAQQILAANCF
jgi:hypothetical protein